MKKAAFHGCFFIISYILKLFIAKMILPGCLLATSFDLALWFHGSIFFSWSKVSAEWLGCPHRALKRSLLLKFSSSFRGKKSLPPPIPITRITEEIIRFLLSL